MGEFKNWKEYMNATLTRDGQFASPTIEHKGDTEIATFESTKKDSETVIKVGYLKENVLIYLHILDPRIPGHNKFVEKEYFHEHDFIQIGENSGNPGLEFKTPNVNGVFEILKRGLTGTETQYILNGSIVKSVVDTGDHPMYISGYDFTNRSFLKKLFSRPIEKFDGIEKREIQLNEIFSGI